MKKVLLAFDKFKHALSAADACNIAALKVKNYSKGFQSKSFPISDGGEGFCEIVTKELQGDVNTIEVSGPSGELVQAKVGLVMKALKSAQSLGFDYPIAILEMAQASGLMLVENSKRDPWKLSSLGTGQMLAWALSQGVQTIVLGIGGSATIDLGLGALEALGLSFLDAEKKTLSPMTPSLWGKVSALCGEVDLKGVQLILASDVQNRLLGNRGAVKIYGEQKGLKPSDFDLYEQGLKQMALKLCQYYKQPESFMMEPGMGAAGGIGFGLSLACGAVLHSGFEVVSDFLGMETYLDQFDIIFTGEGFFDLSSFDGKGPGELIQLAKAMKLPVFLFVGKISDEALLRLQKDYPFVRTFIITPDGTPLSLALSDAKGLLSKSIERALKEVL